MTTRFVAWQDDVWADGVWDPAVWELLQQVPVINTGGGGFSFIPVRHVPERRKRRRTTAQRDREFPVIL